MTTARDALVAVLEQHNDAQYDRPKRQWQCRCGASVSNNTPRITHRAHVVDELVKAMERAPLCGAYPLGRLEAAYEAHRYAPRTRGLDTTGPMRAALTASDAVMFSEEAVERAAKAAYEAQRDGGEAAWEEYVQVGSSYADFWRDQARAVISALKAGE